MIDQLFTLPSHVRERLAIALESGTLPSNPSEAALHSVLGDSRSTANVLAALGELVTLGVSGRAAGVLMRSTARVDARLPQPDLVWSGPEVAGLHARDTKRVYEELLGSAQRSLCVSTYAYFDGPTAFAILAHRMDEVPQLQVVLLLNIQRKRGDTTNAEHLIRRFANRFWTDEWPGKSRPQVFYDPRALDPGVPGGVLHAKAVVADDTSVFVTSANLTEAALERNIELGLLIRDSALAASVSAHFRGLIDRELLKPLPTE